MTAIALAYLHLPFVKRRTGAPSASVPSSAMPDPVVPLAEFDETCRPVSAWRRDVVIPDLLPADSSPRRGPRRRRGGES